MNVLRMTRREIAWLGIDVIRQGKLEALEAASLRGALVENDRIDGKCGWKERPQARS